MSVELKVPSVGESVTEVQIGPWRKREGDRVERDESVVEIESDKATVDLLAPASGIVEKLLKKQGETAAVGETIGYLSAQEDSAAGQSQPQKASATAAVKQQAGQTTIGSVQPSGESAKRVAAHPVHPSTASEKSSAKQSTHAMPSAERLMAQHGIDPATVRGTGPGGRVLKEDVQRRINQEAPMKPPAPAESPNEDHPPAAPAAAVVTTRKAPAEKTDLEIGPRYLGDGNRQEEFIVMSPIRRRIAERLVEAQHVAALLTTFNEIDMSEVMALRSKFKEIYQERYGVKLGFMSFFVKAAVDALKHVPQVNAEIREPHIVYKNYYDIGIAVGGGKGLVVPILRNAEFMSFAEIETTIGDFARRAADNKIRLEELQGGTFTISNGGVYGSLLSTPIVNPPQSAILGLHAIQDRPVARDGQVVVRPMMYVALTYDHRVVDGREAVLFLKRIKEGIEDPTRLLIEV
jgi:2-oxoglutarate dehydrogenase E2 component (dihydrolipoamide succinyltransferase)